RPTVFLAPGRSTPVLPPIAASTCASNVVGICTKSMPRRKHPAAKPARSPTLPPPKAISRWYRFRPAGGGAADRIELLAVQRQHAGSRDDERGPSGEPILQLGQHGRQGALPHDD